MGGGGGTEKEKEGEKIPHMCESITHAPHLGGKCGNIVTIVNITPVA